MTEEMSKAVCWELATPTRDTIGLRVMLAGPFVGTQELSSNNARPRWQIKQFATAALASEEAVRATETFENDYHATLVIQPAEILLHPSEVASMYAGRPISPSLRARIFTSLTRRDPRAIMVMT